MKSVRKSPVVRRVMCDVFAGLRCVALSGIPAASGGKLAGQVTGQGRNEEERD